MKKFKLLTSLSTLGVVAAAVPVVATSCSNKETPVNLATQVNWFRSNINYRNEMTDDEVQVQFKKDQESNNIFKDWNYVDVGVSSQNTSWVVTVTPNESGNDKYTSAAVVNILKGNQDTWTLADWKANAAGYIGAHAARAIARQPEAEGKIRWYVNLLDSAIYSEKTVDATQVRAISGIAAPQWWIHGQIGWESEDTYGSGFEGVLEGVARQPEFDERYRIYIPTIVDIVLEDNNKDANNYISEATGMLCYAGACQPEAWEKMWKTYREPIQYALGRWVNPVEDGQLQLSNPTLIQQYVGTAYFPVEYTKTEPIDQSKETMQAFLEENVKCGHIVDGWIALLYNQNKDVDDLDLEVNWRTRSNDGGGYTMTIEITMNSAKQSWTNREMSWTIKSDYSQIEFKDATSTTHTVTMDEWTSFYVSSVASDHYYQVMFEETAPTSTAFIALSSLDFGENLPHK